MNYSVYVEGLFRVIVNVARENHGLLAQKPYYC